MATRLDSGDKGFAAAFQALLEAKRETAADVDDAVARILADVREKGDAAVIDYTRQFDGFELTDRTMRLTANEIAAARAQVDKDVLAALELAAGRIADFHKKQAPKGLDFTDAAGLRLGYRWTPVSAVGIYVPGGKAAYPSSVIMNAVPAKVAGVREIIMVVPAPGGERNDLVLGAAAICGVDRVFTIGGAQAVAALAYGTATIPAVDKIVGPGNAYVAAAKRRVFGVVGIDMIAGPSEILVICDGSTDPDWVAMDLFSQAEHDEMTQAILLCPSLSYLDKVAGSIRVLIDQMQRKAVIKASLEARGAD